MELLYNNVFTVSQVADYIGISEEEVLGLIDVEKNILEKTNTFTGKMVPYFMPLARTPVISIMG